MTKRMKTLNFPSSPAISPVDGRYFLKAGKLRLLFSEYGLIKYRLIVEIKWLSYLAQDKKIVKNINLTEIQKELDLVLKKFDVMEAEKIKIIERQTNHDVKAIEYYIKNVLNSKPKLRPLTNYIHFGCTSEDINNLAYGLIMGEQEKLLCFLRSKNYLMS